MGLVGVGGTRGKMAAFHCTHTMGHHGGAGRIDIRA